jgi:molybdenum cofactor cytidylyltransferase
VEEASGLAHQQAVIPAIVLAAGKSSRMGRPKALLPIGTGETFLTRILKELRAGGVERIIVVLGGHAAEIRASLLAHRSLGEGGTSDPSLVVVDNPRFEQGQLTSLLVGLAAADTPDTAGVMMTLVDLPLITAETVRAVLDAQRRAPDAPLIRPRRGTRHGHPVIFHRRLFDELRHADPSTGAKPIVRAHAAEEVSVDVDDDGPFTDIDTPEDYARFIG